MPPEDGLNRALAVLGRRWLALDDEARDLENQIRGLIRAHAPALLTRHGVGALTAAQLLITAGANPARLRNDSALAAIRGVSPVDASSGKTRRHRLNRGGDRAANNALWTIAHVRMISDARTRDYAAKRTATGNSRREIMRLLQRYIVRELYPLIISALQPAEPAEGPGLTGLMPHEAASRARIRRMDLDLLDHAVAARRPNWEGTGASVEICRCGFDAKPAASLRAESSSRAVELVLWASGEAELTYAELQPRITDPRTEHYDLATPTDLESCLDDFEAHLAVR